MVFFRKLARCTFVRALSLGAEWEQLETRDQGFTARAPGSRPASQPPAVEMAALFSRLAGEISHHGGTELVPVGSDIHLF